jgi:HEAT repeat protein
MRRMIETVVFAATVAWGVASTGVAHAADASRSGGGMPPATVAKLKSTDLAQVRAGLDDARLSGPRAAMAVPAILALLRSGLPYPLAEAAIDTLGDIGAPDAASTFVEYAEHRDVNVRRAAIRALAKTTSRAGVPIAAAALRAALSDPDAKVRATAATGLGSLKAKAAVPDLFLALDHHVYEAAVSLGELCVVADCEALVGRLGRIPFDVATTGIEPVLFRPSGEISDDVKVAIVAKLRALGTHDANKFLRAVQGRWPKGTSPKVKQEIDASVQATMASPGGDS